MKWTLILACSAIFALQFSMAPQVMGQDQPAPEQKEKPKKQDPMQFIKMNKAKGYVDVEGRICLQDGMLELFATTPKGKTHEAIVELLAPAKLIHFHLLLLGAKNGSPGYYKFDENNKPQPVAPTGEKIEISVIYTPKDKKEPVVLKLSDLIIDAAGKPMKDKPFLFAGSRISKTDAGVQVYEAENGNVISLVSFGDEMLAYPLPASHKNSDLVWSINRKNIPPINSKVKVRLQLVKAKKAPATQPAGQ